MLNPQGMPRDVGGCAMEQGGDCGQTVTHLALVPVVGSRGFQYVAAHVNGSLAVWRADGEPSRRDSLDVTLGGNPMLPFKVEKLVPVSHVEQSSTQGNSLWFMVYSKGDVVLSSVLDLLPH
jgi:hypothetical protein